jgi:very-short-patch-repair endonuclease
MSHEKVVPRLPSQTARPRVRRQQEHEGLEDAVLPGLHGQNRPRASGEDRQDEAWPKSWPPSQGGSAMSGRWLSEDQVEQHQRKFGKVSLAAPVAKASLAPARRVMRSDLEAELERQITEAGIEGAQYDCVYLVGNRCRADVLFQAQRLAIEVQGGCHVVRAKAHADIRKAAESLLQGYRLLPVDKEAIRSGDALRWIQQLLKGA